MEKVSLEIIDLTEKRIILSQAISEELERLHELERKRHDLEVEIYESTRFLKEEIETLEKRKKELLNNNN
jgi:predicted metallo-beta-lactamase superfamily hydrolase